MALITHQTQGPYQTAYLRPKPWSQGLKLRSSVAFQLVDKTVAFIPLTHHIYLRPLHINLSKRKPFKVLSFKGNAQNDESDHSSGSSKFTKTPVQFSHTQEEREIITESPDVQSYPMSYASEDGEDTTAGSLAIQKLFRKWLLMLRTQTFSPAGEVLGEKVAESKTSEDQTVPLKGEAGQLLKSTLVHFLKLDAAISLPLLMFIPFYLTVRMVYGAEVTKELTPMWILGPLIVALYVKIIQGLCSLYAFCFMLAVRLVKNLPSYYHLVSSYISEGKLKAYLYLHFWKPVEDVKNMDYKLLFAKKMKQLQEWAVEKYLDYVESIWPYYCRTIRFLKKANLI
ncbi:uncharacterized protein A4U43_C01F26680 [Asparagus officinalis]|uniref:Embryo defective 2759 n=1 Tax=Asparagus officinalis TaxID=4686 RepID=A0A5P1FT01_ASPOF|nr:uncharacterized protein LOC109828903 [Asparagus officinalis]ONK81222.1 uncharacterized protein A4U43_C01F26680 [Asparagus officinalis]